MALRHLFVLTLLYASGTLAQGDPDLLGTWTFDVAGLEPHAQCGQSIQKGVLTVERRITARAYRGNVQVEDSYEKCQGTQTSESKVTVRVKDDLVTLEYDEDGWEMERLRLADSVMKGERGDGVTTLWQRLPQLAAPEPPTAEQLAALDAFLARMEPELSTKLSAEYRKRLFSSLQNTGLDQVEAGQVADLTIERMTDCMLELMRAEVVAREIPVEKILEEDNVTVIFNPQNVDLRSIQCIDDASWNAGVRIR